MHFQMRQSGELHLSEGVGDRCAIWFSPLLNHSGDVDNVIPEELVFGGNARFFYCHDDGAAVWILNGYEKKTEKIPLREIRQAKRLKRKYGL